MKRWHGTWVALTCLLLACVGCFPIFLDETLGQFCATDSDCNPSTRCREGLCVALSSLPEEEVLADCGCEPYEFCYLDVFGGTLCTNSCETSFNHAARSYEFESCVGLDPCVFERGRWLCRETSDFLDCDDYTTPTCLDDRTEWRGCEDNSPLLLKCHAGTACSGASGRCAQLEAPTEWTCDQAWFGGIDGCDCGCGVVDPDCFDATVASCDSCAGCMPDCSCTDGDCETPIVAGNNALCE